MMEVYCFDMMLFQLAAERFAGGPNFMFHDSHLFDGVDARQVRGTRRFGVMAAGRVEGQYLVATDSDEFSRTGLRNEADVVDAVLIVWLTNDELGGLFDFRFD